MENEEWIVCAVPGTDEEDGMFVFLDLTPGHDLKSAAKALKGKPRGEDDVRVIDVAAARFVPFGSADDLMAEGLLDRTATKWRLYAGLDEANPTDLDTETEWQAGVVRETSRLEFFFREIAIGGGVDKQVMPLTEWQSLPSLALSRWEKPSRLPSSAVEDDEEE